MINMAILKQRLNRKNSSGGYDTIYLETIATIVKMSETDNTTVATAIANKANANHTHETNFSIIASNEMNLVNGYNDDNGRGDVYFNVSGANKPIKAYGFMNGKGAILGICTHSGNINAQVKNALSMDNLGVASLELNQHISNLHGGYIDFHYAGTTEDYTSRIIESANGRLSLQNTNGIQTTDATPASPLLRNIECHTTDITPKTTALATGRIYVVYE